MLGWICAALVAVLGVILSPLVAIVPLPAAYTAHRSEHPGHSPFSPPKFNLSKADIEAYDRDGVIFLRNVLPKHLAEKLDIAGHDLMNSKTMHCELSKFVGPPIFHGYDRYCERAQLIHDYLRDVTYRGPFAHIAAQLLKADGALRNIADVFMGGGQLPKRWHMDFLAFAAMSESKAVPCEDGLIVWMPLEDSYVEKNGMLYVNGSHTEFKKHFSADVAGTAGAYDVNTHSAWVANATKAPIIDPHLRLGDAAVFSQCTLHTTSGVQSGGARRAYQLRFAKNAVTTRQHGAQSILVGPPEHPDAPIASPQIWPQTLPVEDSIRAKGFVTFPLSTWLSRMSRKPVFTLFTLAKAVQASVLGDYGEN